MLQTLPGTHLKSEPHTSPLHGTHTHNGNRHARPEVSTANCSLQNPILLITFTEARASATGVDNIRRLTLGPAQLISSSFMSTACLSQSKDLVQGQAQTVPLRKSLIQSTQSKDGQMGEETQQTEA